MKQGVNHYCLSKCNKKFYIVNKKRKGDITKLRELQNSMIESGEDSKNGIEEKGRQAMFLSVRVCTFKVSKVFPNEARINLRSRWTVLGIKFCMLELKFQIVDYGIQAP